MPPRKYSKQAKRGRRKRTTKNGCWPSVRSTSAVVAEQKKYRAAPAEYSHSILVRVGVGNVVYLIRTKDNKDTLH